MRLVAMIVALSWTSAFGAVIYVDDSAAGTNNGTSWDNAYTNLQDGLKAAAAGDEVRVGHGMYRPAEAGGDPGATFAVTGTIVRGGYAGVGAADPDANDPEAFVTTLSGDLNQDDPGPPDTAPPSVEFFNDNAHHVVTVSGSSSETEFAGFVITHGVALGFDVSGQGGGILNIGGSLVIRR